MARQIAMYLCRELTDLSLPKIGAQFGNRDHTTVMYADRKINQLLAERRASSTRSASSPTGSSMQARQALSPSRCRRPCDGAVRTDAPGIVVAQGLWTRRDVSPGGSDARTAVHTATRPRAPPPLVHTRAHPLCTSNAALTCANRRSPQFPPLL